jgi:hypothetical protein
MKTAAAVVILFFAALLAAQEIPPGTALPVALDSSLDARKMERGQRIVAHIAQNVPLPSHAVLRAGSRVEGRVVKAEMHGDGGSQLVFEFDALRANGRTLPVSTKLRAIASLAEVETAQLPSTRLSSGSESDATWTTTQIGGDDVYRGGGHVMHDERVVGDPVEDGVLAELIAVPNTGCDYGSDGHRLALWVFSSDACGPYGLRNTAAENSDPEGQIILNGTKNVHIPKGSAMLLVVIPPPPPQSHP